MNTSVSGSIGGKMEPNPTVDAGYPKIKCMLGVRRIAADTSIPFKRERKHTSIFGINNNMIPIAKAKGWVFNGSLEFY